MLEESIRLMYLFIQLKRKIMERVIEINLRFLLFKSGFLFPLDYQQAREELIWNANNGLVEKQIDQFLLVAR